MEMRNYYETEKVKKYCPKFIDKQKEFTGMDLNTRILLCGGTGAGKSNAFLNYLELTSKPKGGTFRKIYLISKVKEPLYEMLQDDLGDKLVICRTVGELPSVQEFPDLNCDNPHFYLVVLDDCVTDKDKQSVKKINEYYAFSRKKGITTLYLSQSYFQTPIFARQNCNYLILLSIKSTKDLSRILREYSLPDIELDQIHKMFLYATAKPLNCLKITADIVPMEKKFARNYLDYLNPEDFKNSDVSNSDTDTGTDDDDDNQIVKWNPPSKSNPFIKK